MDPSLLIKRVFRDDPGPFAAGDFPGEIPALAELRGHVLFETSGSSGAPKWIALSKAALLESAAAVNRHLEVTTASCWGLALPLRHVGGFGVVVRAYAAGCQSREFGPRWDAPAFAAWLAKDKVTHTSLVPTQVHDLASAGLHAPPALRAVVVGGGHLDVETGRAARALGWPVLAGYGMTEAASQIATQDLATLGNFYQPAPLPLLPIWRAELSSEMRLRISGPALFSGTLIRQDGLWSFQARAMEWHETSDRVLLENNLLSPLGRADLMVKVLGELVDLEMIERELSGMSAGGLPPGMFVVVALPDARTEHALVPVFDATINAVVIRDVLSAYAKQAAGFRRLGPAVLLAHIPRSPLGKPCRAEIAAEITAASTSGSLMPHTT
jgi:O-succinylbenzoic acid--CoA ligase